MLGNYRLVLPRFETYELRLKLAQGVSGMNDRESTSSTAADARKAYEAPKLESLGSLESYTQVGSRAGGRVDRGSS